MTGVQTCALPICATKPFELVHSDLKSFPVMSYRKFKYIITFYNDFTSHAWTMALHSKAAAITAAKDFLEMVRVQHNAHVIGWMLLRFHRTIIILLTFFLLRVTLADTVCSMDVPRDSGSLTRTFSFMSHVPGSCTCMSPIPFHMSFHFTVSDCRLIYAYISRLCLLLSTRLQSHYSWTMTHL